MTLSPIFRSSDAVDLLEREGIWDKLAPELDAQMAANSAVIADFKTLIDPQYISSDSGALGQDRLQFLQENFFLVLFRSVFRCFAKDAERLQLYSELNFCIRGTITAADNLFDDEGKSWLPLRLKGGQRFQSILQLMAFERLSRGVLDRGFGRDLLGQTDIGLIQRRLFSLMAGIGTLEGSEEAGVAEVLEPRDMIPSVHALRGGDLFALSFVAPKVMEPSEQGSATKEAEQAIRDLGIAFQIVDDLVDFEDDIGRQSNNLLAAQIHHYGSAEEKIQMEALARGQPCPPDLVETCLAGSAGVVLEMAQDHAMSAASRLQKLGHWLDPTIATELVRAIVGLEGSERIEAISL